MGYYAIEEYGNDLYHHGVKGMKWGVRKAVNRYTASARRLGSNISSKGVVKGAYHWHAQNVSNRLNNIDDDRKGHMSARQMKSFNKSKAYWNGKAAGKSNLELRKEGNYRGIVKRTYDSYRSRSLGTRAALRGAQQLDASLRQRKATNAIIDDLGSAAGGAKHVGYGNVAASTVTNTAASLIGEEIVAKIFGHY